MNNYRLPEKKGMDKKLMIGLKEVSHIKSVYLMHNIAKLWRTKLAGHDVGFMGGPP